MKPVPLSHILKHLGCPGILNDFQHDFRQAQTTSEEKCKVDCQTNVIVLDFSKGHLIRSPRRLVVTNCQSMALITLKTFYSIG